MILLVADGSTETKIEMVLGAKRALFRAALLADAAADEVEAPGSCLSLAQALFVDKESVEEAVAPDGLEEPPEQLVADEAAPAEQSRTRLTATEAAPPPVLPDTTRPDPSRFRRSSGPGSIAWSSSPTARSWR